MGNEVSTNNNSDNNNNINNSVSSCSDAQATIAAAASNSNHNSTVSLQPTTTLTPAHTSSSSNKNDNTNKLSHQSSKQSSRSKMQSTPTPQPSGRTWSAAASSASVAPPPLPHPALPAPATHSGAMIAYLTQLIAQREKESLESLTAAPAANTAGASTSQEVAAPPLAPYDLLILKSQLEAITAAARHRQQLEHDQLQISLALKYQQDVLALKQEYERREQELSQMHAVHQAKVDQIAHVQVQQQTMQQQQQQAQRELELHQQQQAKRIKLASEQPSAVSSPSTQAHPQNDSSSASSSSSSSSVAMQNDSIPSNAPQDPPTVPTIMSDQDFITPPYTPLPDVSVTAPWTPLFQDENDSHANNSVVNQISGNSFEDQEMDGYFNGSIGLSQPFDSDKNQIEFQKTTSMIDDRDSVASPSNSSIISTNLTPLQRSKSSTFLRNYLKMNVLAHTEEQLRAGKSSDIGARQWVMWITVSLDASDQSTFLEQFSVLNLPLVARAVAECKHHDIQATGGVPCCPKRAPVEWGGEFIAKQRALLSPSSTTSQRDSIASPSATDLSSWFTSYIPTPTDSLMNFDLSPDEPAEDDMDGIPRLRLTMLWQQPETSGKAKHKRKKSEDEEVNENTTPNTVSSTNSNSSSTSFTSSTSSLASFTPSTHAYRMYQVNRAYERLTGWSQADTKRIMASIPVGHVTRDLREDHAAAIHWRLCEMRVRGITEAHSYQVRFRKDGSTYYCLSHIKYHLINGLFCGGVESFIPLPENDELHPPPPFIEGVDVDEDTLMKGFSGFKM